MTLSMTMAFANDSIPSDLSLLQERRGRQIEKIDSSEMILDIGPVSIKELKEQLDLSSREYSAKKLFALPISFLWS